MWRSVKAWGGHWGQGHCLLLVHHTIYMYILLHSFFIYLFFIKLSFLPLHCCNCRGVKRRYWKLTPLWDWDGVKSEWGGRVWEPWCCRLNALMRLCLPWKRTSTGVKQNRFVFFLVFFSSSVCLSVKEQQVPFNKEWRPSSRCCKWVVNFSPYPVLSVSPLCVMVSHALKLHLCYHVEIFSCSVCDASAGFFPSHRYAAFINDREFSCLY